MYSNDSSIEAEVKDLKRRIRVLETQAPVGFTSVSRGALRIISPEGLIVGEPGGVTGSARVYGLLYGDGTLKWVGPWDLDGDGKITGDVSLTGKIQVGDVTIDGDTGEIRVAGSAPIRLRTVGGGAVIEVGGTTIREQDGLLKIDTGGGNGIVQDSFSLQLKQGGVAFAAGSFGPQIIGLPTTAQSNYPGSFPGAVIANSTGQLYRVV